jgi:hypothetical protein
MVQEQERLRRKRNRFARKVRVEEAAHLRTRFSARRLGLRDRGAPWTEATDPKPLLPEKSWSREWMRSKSWTQPTR